MTQTMIDDDQTDDDVVAESLVESGTEQDAATADVSDAALPVEDGDDEADGAERQPGVASVVKPVVAGPVAEPFVVRAHGKQYTFENAKRIPGQGLLIPDGPEFQRVQQMLARGVEAEVVMRPRLRHLEAENTELRESQSEAETHATQIINWFSELAAAGPDVVAQVVEQWDRELPRFEARVEMAKVQRLQKDFARQQRAHEPSADEQRGALMEEVRNTGEQLLVEAAAQHGLTADDAKAIAARLLRRPEMYLSQRNENGRMIPMIEDTQLLEDFAEEAKARGQQRSSVTAVSAAAAKNAAVKAGSIPSATRAPAKAVTPVQPRSADGTFKNKDEYDAWVNRRTSHAT